MSLLNFMRCLVLALLCVAFSACAAAPIAQQGNTVPKVALLIGNAAYQQDRYSLKNPVNDIDLIAQSLRKLGFAITRHTNLSRADMQRALSDFAADVPAWASSITLEPSSG